MAGKATSAEASARLSIEWETKHLVTVQRPGYGSAVAPLSAVFDGELSEFIGKAAVRPGLIWFQSLAQDPKAEKRMFDDDNVVVASRWFNNAKIYVEDITDAKAKEQYSANLPLLVFLDAKGNEVTRLSGNGITASSVYAAQQQASAAHYKETLSTLVDRYSSFIKKLDKASSSVDFLQTELNEHLEHVQKHDCEPGRKAVKETTADLAKARSEKDKLLAEEKKLLNPPLKAPAPAPAKTTAAAR
jgi:paraquat-inducible protein B